MVCRLAYLSREPVIEPARSFEQCLSRVGQLMHVLVRTCFEYHNSGLWSRLEGKCPRERLQSLPSYVLPPQIGYNYKTCHRHPYVHFRSIMRRRACTHLSPSGWCEQRRRGPERKGNQEKQLMTLYHKSNVDIIDHAGVQEVSQTWNEK
jgi:hypothetical protein